MNDLIRRVETEPPSRELDALIAVELGWRAVGADPLNDTCRNPDGEWGELPFFTSSVDAGVPDENIIMASHNLKTIKEGTQWIAWHFVKGSGESILGRHPTSEASARRAAAMRARAKEQADG